MHITDRDYERLFVGSRQMDTTHFLAIDWDDTGAPVKFAFGYWTPDGVYHQGFVDYDRGTKSFARPAQHMIAVPRLSCKGV